MAGEKIKQLTKAVATRVAALRQTASNSDPSRSQSALQSVAQSAQGALNGARSRVTAGIAGLRGRFARADAAPASAAPRTSRTFFYTRRAALIAAVAGIALAAGQFVQSGPGASGQMTASVLPEAKLGSIVPLSETGSAPGPEDIFRTAGEETGVIAALTDATKALPDVPASDLEKADMAAIASPETSTPMPEALAEGRMATEPDLPQPVSLTAEAAVAAPTCTPSLVGMPGPAATIDIDLSAPCAPDATVVLRHAGLAVSGRTSATGSFSVSLPAMHPKGRILVQLEDGTELETAIATNLAGLRRYAVQWKADDRFQLHALEDGADYGDPGHIWSGAPQAQAAGGATAAGWLVTLGDTSVEMPMRAEIYTFPSDPARKVRLTLEAEVTATTCARDILGQTLVYEGDTVTVSDVTFAMPGCDAIGDFLVLNNLIPETTLAAAE